jgi:hypothetical protein
MTNIHGVIDIETLGVDSDAIVLSLGACKFDPHDNTIYDEFHVVLDVDDQMSRGRTTTDKTLEWWAKQSPEAIDFAFSENDRMPIDEFLIKFHKWHIGVDRIWAQGVLFDMGIIENLCHMYNANIPWKFWNVRDSRTLFDFVPTDPRKKYTFTAHDALADAKMQAKCIQEVVKTLNLKLR